MDTPSHNNGNAPGDGGHSHPDRGVSPSVVGEDDNAAREGESARVVSEVGSFLSSGDPLTQLHQDSAPASVEEELLPGLQSSDLSRRLPRADLVMRDGDLLFGRDSPRAEVVLRPMSVGPGSVLHGQIWKGTPSPAVLFHSSRSAPRVLSHLSAVDDDRDRMPIVGADLCGDWLQDVSECREPPSTFRPRPPSCDSTAELARLAGIYDAVVGPSTVSAAASGMTTVALSVRPQAADRFDGATSFDWENSGMTLDHRCPDGDRVMIPGDAGVADWRGGPISSITRRGGWPLPSAYPAAVGIVAESRPRDRAVVETSQVNGQGDAGVADWRGGPISSITRRGGLPLPSAYPAAVGIVAESRPRDRAVVETSQVNGQGDAGVADWRGGPISSITRRGGLPLPSAYPAAVGIVAESRPRDRAVVETSQANGQGDAGVADWRGGPISSITRRVDCHCRVQI